MDSFSENDLDVVDWVAQQRKEMKRGVRAQPPTTKVPIIDHDTALGIRRAGAYEPLYPHCKLAWKCDACGGRIQSIKDGWVEFLWDMKTGAKRGFRIVHHLRPRCQYKSEAVETNDIAIGDHHLEVFLGVHGLARLLALADDAADPAEVVRLLQRIHFPSWSED